MKRNVRNNFNTACLFLGLLFVTATGAIAQTTVFLYQDVLPKSVTPATGTFEIEVRLFDAVTGGTQIGDANLITGVEVKNRGFLVALDFGADAFPGADRFIEVSVREKADQPFEVVTPRRQIFSVPYAIRSLNSGLADNALNLGGVEADDFVLTNDSRLSDSRNPNPGSNNYIQNTTSQQTPANFNISGDGTLGGTLSANIINSATQYNIGGQRILSAAGMNNTFTGIGTGAMNTAGQGNAFFGTNAGAANTTGNFNAVFGAFAGNLNTTGIRNAFFGTNSGRVSDSDDNSFFGTNTGFFNTTGERNSFFGSLAGLGNTTGNNNAFFGVNAGANNSTASDNSFFGMNAGASNTTGNNNAFFGRSAGNANTTGNFNAMFGSFAGSANTDGIRNAFFGTNSGRVNTTGDDNSFFGTNTGFNNLTGTENAFFGSLSGIGNTTGNNNSFFGANAGANNSNASGNSFFGFNAGLQNTEGIDNAFFGILAGDSNTTGSGNSYFGNRARGSSGISNATAIGNRAFVSQSNSIVLGGISGVNGGSNTNVGIGTTAPADRLDVNGIIRVSTLGTEGATALCRNALNQIANCSSSVRYKTNINNFNSGLDLIRKLRPVSFEWKSGGSTDLGLVAEEVAEVNSLLVTKNEKGETEGVKYDRVGVVLVNAVNEQQAQIEAQQKQINEQKEIIQRQQNELDALKQLICSQNPQAEICKLKD